MKSVVKVLSALMVAIALVSLANVFQICALEGATVFIDPMFSVLQSPPIVSGSTFTVNVTIANITGLVGVQFRLTWDPKLLSCQGIQEVLFHTVTPLFNWSNIWSLELTYNNTAGYAEYMQTWQDDGAAVADGYAPANVTTANFPPEGKIALATLTMRVGKTPPFRGSLSCALGLSDVIVGDIEAHQIPLATMNGTFTVNWSPPALMPFFSVDPPTYTASSMGEVFNVSVAVNDMDPGWEAVSFEFKLGYNSTMLQVLNVWEGAWLPQYGLPPNQGTSLVRFLNLTYIQLRDGVMPDVSGIFHSPWPQGSGAVAIIQFNATMQGVFPNVLNCSLHLYDTTIEDTLGNNVSQTASVDGSYNIAARVPMPQITVETETTIYHVGEQILVQGNLTCDGSPLPQVPVMIEVKNPENDTVVAETPVADAQGAYNVTFVLADLTELGNYTVYASSYFHGQNASTTLTFALRSILGDVNGDGTVDKTDAAALVDSFLLAPGDPAYNPNADMNGDGVVNMLDAIILADHFGQHYP